MLITLILFVAVLGISLVLAFLSMRNFQEIPAPHLSYSLYLVRNPSSLNFSFFQKLHNLTTPIEAVVSIERLFKGQDQALVLYGPQIFINHFPELDLLELEDYLSPKDDSVKGKISVNNTICWSYNSAPSSQNQLVEIPNFFKNLILKDTQQFIWQIVLLPIRNTTDSFQITLRTMIVEEDPNERITLAKEIQELISQSTNLVKPNNLKPSGVIYEAFIKRTLIPKEVNSFALNGSQVMSLLGG